MKSEMESMKVNDVWTLVDPPEGVKPIGCKWVFKRKRGADGKGEYAQEADAAISAFLHKSNQ